MLSDHFVSLVRLKLIAVGAQWCNVLSNYHNTGIMTQCLMYVLDSICACSTYCCKRVMSCINNLDETVTSDCTLYWSSNLVVTGVMNEIDYYDEHPV